MAVFGLCAVGGGAARAQEAPVTPFQVVSQLDLECRKAEGPGRPNVFIRQLNPVLRDRLPDQQIVTSPLQEGCVPVAKNGRIPDSAALEVARFVDVACCAPFLVGGRGRSRRCGCGQCGRHGRKNHRQRTQPAV